jgi:hypothetical protein
MESENTGRVEIDGARESKRKSIVIMIIIGAIIVAALFIINYYVDQSNTNPSESVIQCIANRTILLTSPGCGHCALQKEMLGEYLKLFNEISCADDPWTCMSYNITGVPTWVVNNENYAGRKTWEELRKITLC